MRCKEYHKYDFSLIDSNEVFIEVCSRCKHKNITRKGNEGRIDNKKFLQEHKLEFAQKGKIYDKEYNRNTR